MIGAESDAVLYRDGVEPNAWEPDEDATATINYTSGTTARPKGVAADPPQPLAQRGDVRLAGSASTTATCTCTRCRMFHCNGWGMPYAVTGMGGRTSCCARSTAPRSCAASSEHGVTFLCGAPAVVARRPRRRRRLGRARSPARDRCAWSWPARRRPTRTIERVETELGWEFIQIYGLTETAPLLTMNRRRAEWDDLDAGGARRRSSAGPARRRSASSSRVDDEGEVLARSNVVLQSYWEQPEATAEAHRRRLVPHRRRRQRSTTSATSRSRTARRT